MSSTITTTGTSAPVTTTRLGAETVSHWVGRHNDSVAGATPSESTLTTTWKSGAVGKSVSTTRLSGETDPELLARHIVDYTTVMIEYPPS